MEVGTEGLAADVLASAALLGGTSALSKGSAASRPASAALGSGGARKPSKERKAVDHYTPWKDRLKAHRDAVIYVGPCQLGGGFETPESAGADPAAEKPLAFTRLLTASADASVCVWDCRPGLAPVRLQDAGGSLPLPGEVGSGAKRCGQVTAFLHAPPASADDTELAMHYAGFEKGIVAGWDAVKRDLLLDLRGHEAAVVVLKCLGHTGAAHASGDLLTAGHDGTVRVWFARGKNRVAPYCSFSLDLGRLNPASDIHIFPHGNRILTCSWDGKLRSVDLTSHTCTNAIEAFPEGIRALCTTEAASSGDDYIIVGSPEGRISVWTFPPLASSGGGAGKEVLSWRGHDGEVTVLRCNKTRVYSGGEDRVVKVWSRGGALLDELRGHGSAVLSLFVAEKERLLWSASRDHSVRSWCLQEVDNHVTERSRMEHADKESWTFKKIWAAHANAQKKKKPAKGRAGR